MRPTDRVIQRNNSGYLSSFKANIPAPAAVESDLAVQTRLTSIEAHIENSNRIFGQQMHEIKDILCKLLDNNSKYVNQALIEEFEDHTNQVPLFKHMVTEQAKKVWPQLVKSEFSELNVLRYVYLKKK
jgi:hypothetical protein